MPKKPSRLESRQWYEYFVVLGKDTNEIRTFRQWLRDNIPLGYTADITLLATYNIAHCFIRDIDDAMLFKLRWADQLR